MKTRIISGLIGAVLFAAVIYFSFYETLVLGIALAILAFLAAYEMLFNTGLVPQKWLALLSAGITLASTLLLIQKSFLASLVILLLLSSVYIILISVFVIFNHESHNTKSLFSLLLVPAMIGLAFASLYYIFAMSPKAFFLLFIFAWGTDTGAYFVGTFFGKHKLAPVISPKKTVEGSIGGVGSAVLIAVIYSLILKPFFETVALNIIITAALGVVFAIIGMIGDLFTSFIKRDCGIKDYGNIMPGHGGVLDRFDSVLFIAPFYFLAVIILNFTPAYF